ncbi:MAG: long-chain fatty acid--CoA ligase [Lentimicrobiaceae bacterium]|nr:long-chain fatty acid--CoA ligase [Lentimicrobiaceae bacterium]
MSEVTRIFDLLSNYAKQFKPKDDVIAGKEDGVWIKYSLEQYVRYSKELCYGLIQMGIEPGDKIATVMNNRPEWNFLDMAIMKAGAIHVPVYPTISKADYQYIFKHSGIRLIFVAGEELSKRVLESTESCESVCEVFSIKPREGMRDLEQLRQSGARHPHPEEMEARMAAIQKHDLATIIYTSGTSGNPKGVMLSHDNILSNVKALSYIPNFGEEALALSFLPLCHIYERTLNYLYQYLGISIYYAESLATITDNIQEISPDMMCCVPRLLEKIYDRIITAGRKLKGIKRMLFFWAVELALNFDVQGNNSGWYMFKHRIADKLIYSKWRQALGGNFKIIVSGGAAIQPRLVRTFRAAGLPVFEGYGLTESSPVIAVTSMDANGIKIGTVGPVLRGVEVKIAPDGEILARGPNIMLGYYKNPELTAEVIDEQGWLHTGDIGNLEPEGQLRITGRKKEIFKTSLGKYIAPEAIENKIKESPFIDNLIVVGENQKFAAAIVVPDFNHLRSWCKIKGVEYTSDREMLQNPRIKKRLMRIIDEFNKDFGNTEKVKKVEFISNEWSIAGGELTPTLKLKRRFIMKKYQPLIEKLFS